MATVLIVDDRPVNRDLVRTVLTYHGHVIRHGLHALRRQFDPRKHVLHAAALSHAHTRRSGPTTAAGLDHASYPKTARASR